MRLQFSPDSTYTLYLSRYILRTKWPFLTIGESAHGRQETWMVLGSQAGKVNNYMRDQWPCHHVIIISSVLIILATFHPGGDERKFQTFSDFMNNFLIIQVILNMIRHLEDVSPPGVNVMRMMGIHVYVTMSRKITGIVNQIGYIFQHGIHGKYKILDIMYLIFLHWEYPSYIPIYHLQSQI